jgi:hypothetical protein
MPAVIMVDCDDAERLAFTASAVFDLESGTDVDVVFARTRTATATCAIKFLSYEGRFLTHHASLAFFSVRKCLQTADIADSASEYGSLAVSTALIIS